MIGSRILAALLWPLILLEHRLITDKDKEKYGTLPKSEGFVAAFERWGIMAIGVFSGLFGLWIICAAVTLGFFLAGFIDPFIWLRKDGMQMAAVNKNDFKLGIMVNLAPIWLFWIGFLVGGGLGAV